MYSSARRSSPTASTASRWRGSQLRNSASGCFFFSSRRRHTRSYGDWSSDVCSSDLGTVHFERRFPDGRLREKSLEVPKDTLAVEGIAGVLRLLPFDRITSFPVHLLSNEPRVYSISFENRGKEHVRTPAGEFDCYKLEMVPHLGVLNVVRHFYSRAFFWFTLAPPHFWVRYEGPEN